MGKLNITKILTVALAALALGSCDIMHDEPLAEDTGGTFTGYISIILGSTSQSEGITRAPNGGEDGDGREDGTTDEDRVTDATVLFFEDNKGVNGDSSTVIVEAVYFDSFSPLTSLNQTSVSGVENTDGDTNNRTRTVSATYQSQPQEMSGTLDKSKTYHLLVIANAGDLTKTFKDQTLGYVRDYIMQPRSGETVSAASTFVMSSESDASFNFTNNEGTGTAADPYVNTTPIVIERLAARIDIQPCGTAATATDGNPYYAYYDYEVTDEEGKTTGDVFRLTAVIPFNLLASGEYLIKRVSAENDTQQTVSADNYNSIVYLGDETADNNAATNYVIDPWTIAKSGDSGTISDLKYSNPAGTESQALTGSYPVKSVGSDGYYTLAYTMENTSLTNNVKYATGLYFVGTYFSGETTASGDTYTVNEATTGTPKVYTYYIRHSDPDNTYTYAYEDGSEYIENITSAGVMTLGIVRNNIYRVSVAGVQNNGIRLTIKVRPWAVTTHSEIQIEEPEWED